MDSFALGYLISRFFYRIGNFFHHWYIDGSRYLGHHFILILEGFDATLALRITLKYFFEPLYKDYTAIGRILGFVFRTGRIVIGFGVYSVLAVVFFIIYVIWLALPVALVWGVGKFL
ncbi:MAG: hypothetical protein Q7S28_00910 [bacterium]|nr:hypothetical protein [bacterium]